MKEKIMMYTNIKNGKERVMGRTKSPMVILVILQCKIKFN